MTPRVWVERLIESVGDAEALPDGTVLVKDGQHPAVIHEAGRTFYDNRDDSDPLPLHHLAAEHWLALVPVEAAEEHRYSMYGYGDHARLVTRWEPVGP